MTPTNNTAAAFVLKASDSVLLDKLRSEHKILLLCRHQERLSYSQIAYNEGLPLGTVRSRLHRAREALLKLRAEQEAKCPSSS